MKKLSTCVLILACAFPVLSIAQWQWIDKDGRKVYSDRPPPPDIAPKDVLKQPSASAKAAPQAAVAPVASASAAAGPASGSAKLPVGKDATLEARKKQLEEEEEAKRKAAAAKQAQEKSQTCERARSSLTVLQSGIRMKVPNANGDMEFISDASRASEMERIQGVIAAECK